MTEGVTPSLKRQAPPSESEAAVRPKKRAGNRSSARIKSSSHKEASNRGPSTLASAGRQKLVTPQRNEMAEDGMETSRVLAREVSRYQNGEEEKTDKEVEETDENQPDVRTPPAPSPSRGTPAVASNTPQTPIVSRTSTANKTLPKNPTAPRRVIRRSTGDKSMHDNNPKPAGSPISSTGVQVNKDVHTPRNVSGRPVRDNSDLSIQVINKRSQPSSSPNNLAVGPRAPVTVSVPTRGQPSGGRLNQLVSKTSFRMDFLENDLQVVTKDVSDLKGDVVEVKNGMTAVAALLDTMHGKMNQILDNGVKDSTGSRSSVGQMESGVKPMLKYDKIMVRRVPYREIAFDPYVLCRCTISALFAEIADSCGQELLDPAGLLKILQSLFFSLKRTDKKQAYETGSGKTRPICGEELLSMSSSKLVKTHFTASAYLPVTTTTAMSFIHQADWRPPTLVVR